MDSRNSSVFCILFSLIPVWVEKTGIEMYSELLNEKSESKIFWFSGSLKNLRNSEILFAFSRIEPKPFLGFSQIQ